LTTPAALFGSVDGDDEGALVRLVSAFQGNAGEGNQPVVGVDQIKAADFRPQDVGGRRSYGF